MTTHRPIVPPHLWVVLVTFLAGAPLFLGFVFALQSAKSQGVLDVLYETLAFAAVWWLLGAGGDWVITFLATLAAAVLFWFSCRVLYHGAPRVAANRWLWLGSLVLLGACASSVAWTAALFVMTVNEMLLFAPFIAATGAVLAAVVALSSRRRSA